MRRFPKHDTHALLLGEYCRHNAARTELLLPIKIHLVAEKPFEFHNVRPVLVPTSVQPLDVALAKQ